MSRAIRTTLLPLLAAAGLVAVLAAVKVGACASPNQAKLQQYPTQFYIIYTDLGQDSAREAAARLTAMAREYQARTSGFGRRVSGRLPFYMFSKAEDYYAAGGIKGSAGVYMGDKLMAIANASLGDYVWQIVQHEGFHQYVHKAISGRLPVWLNEGMAEYFGAGVWTGDGYVTGVIPQSRLATLKQYISQDALLGFQAMMELNDRQWQEKLSARNYSQAWGMVHFLVHADDGKYREAFDGFIGDVARRNIPAGVAFSRRFGSDTAAFEKRFAQWWAALPANPTEDLYVGATVQTLTSYLARATAAGQKFDSAETFLKAAREGKLACRNEHWLPPSLLEKASTAAAKLQTWSLTLKPAIQLVLSQADGSKFTGSFAFSADGTPNVKLVYTKPPTTQPAATTRQ